MYLFGCEAVHISGLQNMLEVRFQISDIGCHGDLVLPLKLRPHSPELCVGAFLWLNVVHDVNVNVVEHHTVTISSRSNNVVHCVGVSVCGVGVCVWVG